MTAPGPPSRDTDETPFTGILGRFLARVPGGLGAVLVDVEGETVDYVGMVAPFDLRVAAAHGRILLHEIARYEKLGAPRALVIRGEGRAFVVRALEDGYALVLLLAPWAGFAVPARALALCEREIGAEAGFASASARDNARSASVEGGPWPVEVEIDARGRPTRVRALVGAASGVAVEVEVLGALGGPDLRGRMRSGQGIATPNAAAHGYRVRTEHGHELTLVREARRIWYADEPLEPARASGTPPGGR